MASKQPISPTGGLGLRESSYERSAAILAWHLYRAHLAPTAQAAGIPAKIGWHTFRHTFATLLKANGEDVKTVQELLRHANSAVTMNLYAQGVTELKRKAHHRIVQMVIRRKPEEDGGNP